MYRFVYKIGKNENNPRYTTHKCNNNLATLKTIASLFHTKELPIVFVGYLQACEGLLPPFHTDHVCISM